VQPNRPTQTTKTSLKIRKATISEMDSVADFVRSSSSWYKKFIDAKDLKEHEVDQEWIDKNFSRRDFFIGSNGQEDVGTISMQVIGDLAYLGYIYLSTKHVGQGYGHQLMEFAKQRAANKDLKGLVLIAHPEATWATKAYQKFGFEVIAKAKQEVLNWKGGLLKPYYEEGFYLYKLAL
jgi:RimJ/RimL family protein N-acetyltransferase